MMILAGELGTGKSVLMGELFYNILRKQKEPCIYVNFEGPPIAVEQVGAAHENLAVGSVESFVAPAAGFGELHLPAGGHSADVARARKWAALAADDALEKLLRCHCRYPISRRVR